MVWGMAMALSCSEDQRWQLTTDGQLWSVACHLGVGTSHMPVLLAPIPSIGEQKQSTRGAVLIVMSKNELFGWAFYSTKGRNKLTVEHQPVTMFCLDRYIILGTWKIAQKAVADTVDGGNQANNLGCNYKPCIILGKKKTTNLNWWVCRISEASTGCCISQGAQFL